MSVLLPQFANAQAGTGAVRGQVVDSQSRAIVGGRVALSDENNRLVRTQLTGGLGRLEVGDVAQSVTVAAGQEPLQIADATLGNTLEG